MENNLVLFEYNKNSAEELPEIVDNYSMVNAGSFDVCLLATSHKEMNYFNGIHVWIRSADTDNANLMILISFIVSGHPDWKGTSIKIFELCKKDQLEETRATVEELLETGRLPITKKNIEIIVEDPDIPTKDIINQKSKDAALTIMGFRGENLKALGTTIFEGYDDLGTILFVNAHSQKEIN